MRTILLLLGLLILPGGCGLIEVNRLNVQQGNRLEAGEIDRLEIGMTRPQVAELLGTPVLKNPFHANRWDYVYYTTEAGSAPDQVPQRLTIHFSDDTVSRIENRYEPSDEG